MVNQGPFRAFFIHRCQGLQPTLSGADPNLEAQPPVQRYGWERLGAWIHIGVQFLGRFRSVGRLYQWCGYR